MVQAHNQQEILDVLTWEFALTEVSICCWTAATSLVASSPVTAAVVQVTPLDENAAGDISPPAPDTKGIIQLQG